MRRKKQKLSLFEFLARGVLGPLQPLRALSPEGLAAVLGPADGMEVCAPGEEDSAYRVGDAACFPLIVSYGALEFHFEAPATLSCVFFDASSGPRMPGSGAVRFTDAALFRLGRTLPQFQALCRSRGLALGPPRPHAPPYGTVLATAAGVDAGFEVDDPEDPNELPRLRWLVLSL